MTGNSTRVSTPWRRALGRAAMAIAAVTVIGATSIAAAKADWRGRDWHEHHGVGFGFSVGTPGYAYYPAYPYPAYPAYGYPYYYGGNYPTYAEPYFSLDFGRR